MGFGTAFAGGTGDHRGCRAGAKGSLGVAGDGVMINGTLVSLGQYQNAVDQGIFEGRPIEVGAAVGRGLGREPPGAVMRRPAERCRDAAACRTWSWCGGGQNVYADLDVSDEAMAAVEYAQLLDLVGGGRRPPRANGLRAALGRKRFPAGPFDGRLDRRTSGAVSMTPGLR